jgi:hypothetical protein
MKARKKTVNSENIRPKMMMNNEKLTKNKGKLWMNRNKKHHLKTKRTKVVKVLKRTRKRRKVIRIRRRNAS